MKSRYLSRLVAVTLITLGGRYAGAAEETATLGAGCFWCVEAIYERVDGVTKVVSGYAGGKEVNPTYKQVGSGKSTHAEVVQITYDSTKVTYEQLLDLFWKLHDPTDPRGVAPDFGPQYRSILFYETPEQKAIIESSKAKKEKSLSKLIATQVVPFEKFYLAEEYHQDYVARNPQDSYVVQIALPKLHKLGLDVKPKKP